MYCDNYLNMLKKLFLFSFLTLLITNFYATHFVGGNFAVCQTGANSFEVTLRVYRDCNPGNSTLISPTSICVFDAGTNAQVLSFSMNNNLISQQVLTLGDSCYTPTGLCVEEYIFQTTILLNNNAAGYYMTWDDCCRNGIITNLSNPGSDGMTYYVQIPDPALWSTTTVNGTNGNCTPDFGGYPTNGYLCLNFDQDIDFNVTDADGDSLVFSLVSPLDETLCTGKPSAGSGFPYGWSTCNWAPGAYSATNMLGNNVNPPMSIDPQTGVISCYPEVIGVFVFAIKVEEWRNGVKLGEVLRDIQFQSLGCTIDSPPVINLEDSVSVYVNDSICIDMAVEDADGTDTIYLNVVSPDFDLVGTYIAPNQSGNVFTYSNWMGISGNTGTMTHFDSLTINGLMVYEGEGNILMRYCWTPLCEDVDTSYHIDLLGYSLGCSGSDTTQKSVVISVDYTPPPTLLGAPENQLVQFGESVCIDLYASDSIHISDTIFLQPYSANFDFGAAYVPPTSIGGGAYVYEDWNGIIDSTIVMNNYVFSGLTPGAIGNVALRFCWTADCDYVYEKDIYLNYMAFSTACGADTVYDSTHYVIDPPTSLGPQVPNVFSPNGDGENDFYEIYGISDPCYDFMNVTIYNRWGQKVFESDEPTFKWDGTRNGKGACKAGTYYILIEGTYGSSYDSITGERIPYPVKEEIPIQLFR